MTPRAIVLERRSDAAVDIRGAILLGRTPPDHPQPAHPVQLGQFSPWIGHWDPDTLDQITRTKRVFLVRARSNRHARSVPEHEDVATIGMPHLVERAMKADARFHSIQDASETDLGAGHTASLAAACVPGHREFALTGRSTSTTIGHARAA